MFFGPHVQKREGFLQSLDLFRLGRAVFIATRSIVCRLSPNTVLFAILHQSRLSRPLKLPAYKKSLAAPFPSSFFHTTSTAEQLKSIKIFRLLACYIHSPDQACSRLALLSGTPFDTHYFPCAEIFLKTICSPTRDRHSFTTLIALHCGRSI
jgi:hypothetical protein